MKTIVLASLLFGATAATAQPAPTRVRIDVDIKATAAEQLRFSRTLIERVDTASSPEERQRATFTALAHLQAIPMRWPGDTRAVAAAYDLQYDLTMRSGMPMNAVEVMEKAEQLDLPAGEKAAIYRRKASAMIKSGRDADAETAFRAAEERQQHATDFERQQFLQERARFAADKGRHADAAKLLRKLAALPSIDRSTKMTTLLMSLEQSLLAGDRANARADYRELQRLYDIAKSETPPDDGEREFLKIVADALERHRDN